MNNIHTTLLFLAAAALSQAGQAQDLTNNGASITLTGAATLYTSGSLTNAARSTLDLSSGSNQLLIGGNLINAGTATLTPGTASTVILNGTAAQQLDLHGAGLANLTIANTSGGVSLPAGSNADVSGALTLTSGLLTTDASTTLRLLNGASLTGEQTGRYVRGNLAAVRANLAAGTTSTFANGFVLTPTTPLSSLTVTRTTGLRTAQVSYGTNADGTNQGIDQLWQTSAPVAGGVRLSWLADNDNGPRNLAQSQPWARAAAPVAGSSWTLVGASQDASSSRAVQATIPAGSSFSFFTVSTVQAPLPVTLVAFTAQRQGADALLQWTTASELNNAYFQVESSPDGNAFQALGRVAGVGTSSQAQSYQYIDAGLAHYSVPLVYYRLRQVDTDGTNRYSPVRLVQVPAAGWLVQAYPNPSFGAAAVAVLVQTTQAGEVQCTLTDAVGRLVGQQSTLVAAGTTTLPLPAASGLSAGVYALRVSQGGQQQTLRLVRQ